MSDRLQSLMPQAGTLVLGTFAVMGVLIQSPYTVTLFGLSACAFEWLHRGRENGV